MKLFRSASVSAPLLLILCLQNAATSQTIKFSGYEWEVRQAEKEGPGPNFWKSENAFVDKDGRLHLKITKDADHWSCAEITSKRKFPFGRYQFQIEGRIDLLDKNIVLGLFNYPTPEIGKDTTNEIDIEFARWGEKKNANGNYTIWPYKFGVPQTSKTFEFALNGDNTTHRFLWRSDSIKYQSLNGHRDDNQFEFSSFLLKPAKPLDAIPQKPLPLHFNLWLFHGLEPSDGKEVEIIIKSFKYSKS